MSVSGFAVTMTGGITDFSIEYQMTPPLIQRSMPMAQRMPGLCHIEVSNGIV